jgi:hypothetical protein
MYISSDFDSGNIDVRKIKENTAQLEIKTDYRAKSFQWFYFRCISRCGALNTFSIMNAGKSSYPEAGRTIERLPLLTGELVSYSNKIRWRTT